ncbi:MAG: MBOAT family protein [Lachnospiraceae bacterium]|nr:MBOAT family protein [Lachnospiraceae bacterium]
MVFSSTVFLFRFLPVFIILYFVVPGRMKNIILLFGSLFFYAWGEPVYVLLMLFSSFSDYIHGRILGNTRKKDLRAMVLASSIIINLLVLGFFKYADFAIQTLNSLTGANYPLLNLPLPIGISFYTFQTMSYTIDCYRGKVEPQKNLLDFAVFVTMFPQLIAGPIVKYKQVEKQLHERKPDIIQISYGCKRFVIGLAKKVLLANNLGLLWTQVSSRDFGELSVLMAWLGILAFTCQIYFDFSGYSDMAIGLGACLGFSFPENFNYPYIATSVTDFWSRWHMTLSGWFKEYVYIPLGGNRKGPVKQIMNILIVWLLTGIWHGAGWNFLVWGLWFAFWLIMEKLWLRKILTHLPMEVGHIYTLLIVIIGWVFFEVNSFRNGVQYLGAMFGLNGAGLYDGEALFLGLEYLILFIIAVVACTPMVRRVATRMSQSVTGYGLAVYRFLEKVLPALLILLSLAYIVDATFNPFLYFRF